MRQVQGQALNRDIQISYGKNRPMAKSIRTKNCIFRIQLTLLGISLASCASWTLKDQCKKTNWFEYAKQVSFSGKYLEQDQFVKQCREFDLVNAQQLDQGFKLGRDQSCSYDEIERRGKLGEPVNFGFCDGLEPKAMKRRHLDGLLVFCTQANGFTYGKAGALYQKLCSPKQEMEFLPAYHKGRRLHLTERKDLLQKQIAELEETVTFQRRRESMISREYNSIPQREDCKSIQVFNSSTQKNENRTVCEEPQYLQRQREMISSQLESARRNARASEESLSNLQIDLKGVEEELAKLP